MPRASEGAIEASAPKKPRLSSIRSLSIQHNATQLLDGLLFIGGNDCVNDLPALLSMGVTHIVNCTRETPDYFPEHVEYLRVAVTDEPEVAIDAFFDEACSFINKAVDNKRACLVHCSHGMSRSATIVLAYLISHRGMQLLEALDYLRARRRVVSPNVGFMQRLVELEIKVHHAASLDLQEYKKDRFAPIQNLALNPAPSA
ncbi:dual specificity protein phosphatase 2-like [Achlya hypogyna]|uniref:protein-tyrosine-phosphatase n=1 Tax=Achlya hypogyna TaxID=1202772 RepID=A0A1V9Z4X6_ACHHY|nr:dual specificity protein phosphatase 2-like [Achlya hypogyna]